VSYSEEPATFRCGDATLLGILSVPDSAHETGVVVIVGGPQYRGRQPSPIRPARARASRTPDILCCASTIVESATVALPSGTSVPSPKTSDVQSTTCPALPGTATRRPLGAMRRCLGRAYLLAGNEGSTRRSHVPPQSMGALRRKLGGDARETLLQPPPNATPVLGQAGAGRDSAAGAAEFARSLRLAMRGKTPTPQSYQQRMASAWASFDGSMLLILSGADLTAKEFLAQVGRGAMWAGALQRTDLARLDLPEADHTFSDTASRQAVEVSTLDWIARVLPQQLTVGAGRRHRPLIGRPRPHPLD
jgi:hypothetical protein